MYPLNSWSAFSIVFSSFYPLHNLMLIDDYYLREQSQEKSLHSSAKWE